VNILFTIRYFSPFVGGTEKQALTLASSLVQKGIQVKIITSRFERRWPQHELIDGVQVVRLFSPRIKVAGALIFLTCLAGHLIKHRNQYSLIHTFQVGYTSSLSILIGALLRKATLLKLASSGRGGDIQRARRTLWGKVFLSIAKKASKIVMVSTTVKQELIAESVTPEKLCSISNGVDLYSYNDSTAKSQARKVLKLPDRKTIMYTGRLSPEKGVEFLLRSFARVKQSINCQLIIIADGPEKKNIVQIVDRLSISDAVLMMSTVDDVAPYLQAADLFILPSEFEGLSNALLEAMACALPVISTSVGGSIDIIESGVNGLLVEYNNEDHLSQEMSRVLVEHELATSLGKQAKATIERHHDMNSIVDEYREVYNSLIREQAKEFPPSPQSSPHRGEGKKEED
jgi:glycosyltransferase involved in cell wall biosynthesis